MYVQRRRKTRNSPEEKGRKNTQRETHALNRRVPPPSARLLRLLAASSFLLGSPRPPCPRCKTLPFMMPRSIAPRTFSEPADLASGPPGQASYTCTPGVFSTPHIRPQAGPPLSDYTCSSPYFLRGQSGAPMSNRVRFPCRGS